MEVVPAKFNAARPVEPERTAEPKLSRFRYATVSLHFNGNGSFSLKTVRIWFTVLRLGLKRYLLIASVVETLKYMNTLKKSCELLRL